MALLDFLGPAASVFGSILGAEGAEDANQTNLNIARENSAFNAEEAAKNREFQRSMYVDNWERTMQASNTAYPRAVAGMQSAGLNPMLAYSQGGASTPTGGNLSGSQASAAPVAPMQNRFAAAAATAGQIAQISQAEATARKTNAEADVLESELIDETGKTKGAWNSLTAAQKNAETGRINHNALLYIEQQKLTKQQTARVTEEINEVIARTRNLNQDTKLKAVNEILQRHDIPRMQAEDAYFKTPIGKESPHNKYGPQTPFRFIEGLGERLLNRSSARDPDAPNQARPTRTGESNGW